MSRLLNGAMLASCFFGLILLVASDARAGATLSGDSGINQFGTLEVGIDAFGSYIVDGGSVVELEDCSLDGCGLLIAAHKGGSGEVTVTGPGTALSLGPSPFGGSLSVGQQGVNLVPVPVELVTGVMTISGGAVVDSSGFSLVGATAGATGSLTLTGAGSRMVTRSVFSIGSATFIPGFSPGPGIPPGPDFGTERGVTVAFLEISDGAFLNSAFAAISNGSVLGNPTGEETTNATVSVTGSDSEWTLGSLSISPSKNATGTLTVRDGGFVSTPNLAVASVPTFNCVGNLHKPSVGNLEVLSGGSVQADGFRVGENTCPGATPVPDCSDLLLPDLICGTVMVRGEAAQITSSGGGPLFWQFGLAGGNANLKIMQGGKMINNQSTGVMVAPVASGVATIVLSGTGSTFDAGPDLWLGWNPNTNSAGGTCTVNLGKGTVISADHITVGPGCRINGTGTLQGLVTNNGGSIAKNVTIVP